MIRRPCCDWPAVVGQPERLKRSRGQAARPHVARVASPFLAPTQVLNHHHLPQPWTQSCTLNVSTLGHCFLYICSSKSLKVAELKDILAKGNEKLPAKATKADIIAKIIATPAAVDAYRKQYEAADAAAPSAHADDLVSCHPYSTITP